MNNCPPARIALGMLALCLIAGYSANIRAGSIDVRSDGVETQGHGAAAPQSDENSPCNRFPKEQVFDTFEKAFQIPANVKCLELTFTEKEARMRHLPEGVGSLVNMEVISFGCLEQLQDLPEEFGNLRHLKELIIDNGNGCSMNVLIPNWIERLEDLRVLRLYGALDARGASSRRRNVKPLPKELGNLRKLEVLDLGRNGLPTVPAQIARLSKLTDLNLEFNDLRVVPSFVGDLRNLKELSLGGNRIADLPASLAKLQGLKVYLGDNKISPRVQKSLRKRFPNITFSFEDEFGD